MRLLLCGLVVWLLVLALATAGPVRAQGIEVLAPSGQWVTDRAEMLSPAEERTLGQKLAAYADTTSTQVVVVTIPSLEGVPAADYAIELGRRWGVGQEGQDNGAVILVARDDREVFIATGYGLEGAIPDAIAARIVRNVIRPAFRQEHYYAGLSEATDALIAAARGEYTASAEPRSGEDSGTGAALGFILLIILFFVISGLRKHHRGGGGGGRRHRRRDMDVPFPVIIWGGGHGKGSSSGGGFGGFGGFGGGGGFGGFSGGGGSFGGGGAGGSW